MKMSEYFSMLLEKNMVTNSLSYRLYYETYVKHCRADDPNGKLDIVKCAGYWLKDADERGIKHICWDGCMFPNATLEKPETWNTILDTMIKVDEAQG